MKHEYCAEFGDILLRPLHRYDIEYLRSWRNRDDLSRFLSKVGTITQYMQQEWFNSYIRSKDVIFFAIDYKRKGTVGTVALYEIQGNVCQIGKMIIGEDKARGHDLGRLSFLMAMSVGINYLGIEEFALSVHEDNRTAFAIYERIGFEKTGSHNFEGGGSESEMKIGKEEAIRKNPEIMDIKLYGENESDPYKDRGI